FDLLGLGHREFLSALPGHRTTARALASAGVGVRALTTDGEPAAVTEAAVAAEVHQTLDVHGDLAAEVTLDLEVLVDALADGADVVLVQVVRPLVGGDAGHAADLVRA